MNFPLYSSLLEYFSSPCPCCKFFFHSPSQQQPFSMFSQMPSPEACSFSMSPTQQQLSLNTKMPLVGSPLLKDPSKKVPFWKLTVPQPSATPCSISPQYRAHSLSLPQIMVYFILEGASPELPFALKYFDFQARSMMARISAFIGGKVKFGIFLLEYPSVKGLLNVLALSSWVLASQHEI